MNIEIRHDPFKRWLEGYKLSDVHTEFDRIFSTHYNSICPDELQMFISDSYRVNPIFPMMNSFSALYVSNYFLWEFSDTNSMMLGVIGSIISGVDIHRKNKKISKFSKEQEKLKIERILLTN